MERTLSNILGVTVSKDHRNIIVREDAVGYYMDRWDDDTNYERLQYANRADVTADIFRDVQLFLNAPFEECHVATRATSTAH